MKNLIDSRAASLLTGLCLAFAGVHLASAATHNISLSGISFTPANLTVNVGGHRNLHRDERRAHRHRQRC